MQIRIWKGKNRSRVEFLKSEYDPDKKRCVARYIGSQPTFMEELSEELAAKMDDGEKAEANHWLEEYNREQQARNRRWKIKGAARELGELAEAVARENISAKQATEIYQQMNQVAIELKKQGWTKRKALAQKNP